MTFSEKVKFRRESMGYSQRQLAELVGVTTKVITGYEKDYSRPRGTTAHKLAKALGVSVAYLINDEITDPLYELDMAPYVEETREKMGYSAGKEVNELLRSNMALFAGGKLDQDEKDKFYEAITKAYWAAKNELKRIYGRKKEDK
ncbi:MAG: helix-turn-helix transcriptional regulator [Clostridiales bacterium]|nr:helix-turn-helix transcriptional regulator [Clostridiales bacterium]